MPKSHRIARQSPRAKRPAHRSAPSQVGTAIARRVSAAERDQARAQLLVRVRAQRPLLAQEILTSLPPAPEGSPASEDSEYMAGLASSVGAALDHALLAIERGSGRGALIPPVLVAQAHRAARAGVSVETVLRRYLAGSTLLADRIVREAERCEPPCTGVVLREVLAIQGTLLDELMARTSAEHALELERLARSPLRLRTRRVKELLAGATHVKSAKLGYELHAWHVALIATGINGLEALRSLAASLGHQLLWLPRGQETLWAWLGAGQPLPVGELERIAGAKRLAEAVMLSAGEPGFGVDGFRLTHRQAQATLRVALRTRQPLTRYADVGLLACVLQDPALASSIVEIYLSPLGPADDRGASLRQTLRAYLNARGNASSAASALGVARHTVENRLRQIEGRLGQRLRTHQAELEVALRLEALPEASDGAA